MISLAWLIYQGFQECVWCVWCVLICMCVSYKDLAREVQEEIFGAS